MQVALLAGLSASQASQPIVLPVVVVAVSSLARSKSMLGTAEPCVKKLSGFGPADLGCRDENHAVPNKVPGDEQSREEWPGQGVREKARAGSGEKSLIIVLSSPFIFPSMGEGGRLAKALVGFRSCRR